MNSFIFKVLLFFEDFCLEDFTRSREGKTIWPERPRYITWELSDCRNQTKRYKRLKMMRQRRQLKFYCMSKIIGVTGRQKRSWQEKSSVFGWAGGMEKLF